MLSKEKTLLKAKISLALDNDNKESFRKHAAKIEAWFDKENFIRAIDTTLGIIVKKIEPKRDAEKYLTILREEMDDFYYQIVMIRYEFNEDLNSALERIDNLIEGEEGRIKTSLLEHKLNYLLGYQAPTFLKDKVNEEIEKVMNTLEDM